MKPDLRVIPPATETPAKAATRLQQEASEQAATAVENLLHNLNCAEADLLEIAELAAAPPGVREECRQLAAQIAARADTIMSIKVRAS